MSSPFRGSIILEQSPEGVTINGEEYVARGLYDGQREVLAGRIEALEQEKNDAERRLDMIRVALNPGVSLQEKALPTDTPFECPKLQYAEPSLMPGSGDEFDPTEPRRKRRLNVTNGTVLAWLFILGVLIGGVAVPRSQDRPTVVETVTAPAAEQPSVRPVGPPQPTRRTFSCAPVAGADAYDVSFYAEEGGVRNKVVREPRATFWLEPGVYQWYVWPVRNGITDTAAVVQSSHTESG